MGCANSIGKKPLNYTIEQTTFDDVDDEDSAFNSAEFSTTLRWSIASCTSVLARNIVIINLVRLQHENSIVIEYTVTTVDASSSIISLMSSIATYIATGAMTSYLRVNDFSNVSANTPQCYMKFFDLSPTKNNHVLKIIQKFAIIPDPELLCNLLRGGQPTSETVAWEMAHEVANIIGEQKTKKEENKKAQKLLAVEMQAYQPGRDQNYGLDDDTLTRVNRQIRDISVMKRRENEQKQRSDGNYVEDNESMPAVCVSASMIIILCTAAIRRHLSKVPAADVTTVRIVYASPLEGKASGINVVYTVNMRLSNVASLTETLIEAITKGYTKSFMNSEGWPNTLMVSKVLDSTSYALLQAKQTFLGLKLPLGCPYFDFLDSTVSYNDSADTVNTVNTSEPDPEFQINENGDFECITLCTSEEETKEDFAEGRKEEGIENEGELEKEKRDRDTVKEMVREKDRKEKIKAKEREKNSAWEREKAKGKDLRGKDKEKEIDVTAKSREESKEKESNGEQQINGAQQREEDEEEGGEEEDEDEGQGSAEGHDGVCPTRMVSLRRSASTPVSVKGVKSERRVSFENFLRIDRMQGKNEESFREKRKGRETDKEPLLRQSVIDRHKSSEFHAKYEEIVGAKKECGSGKGSNSLGSRRSQSVRIDYHKPSLDLNNVQKYWDEEDMEENQGKEHERGEGKEGGEEVGMEKRSKGVTIVMHEQEHVSPNSSISLSLRSDSNETQDD